MLKMKDILGEEDKRLRQENNDVVFPLTKDERQMIKDMHEYLHSSQIDEIAEKLKLRPGMGLAAPQVGINKKFFVIVYEEEENVFNYYTVVNPKLVSHSEELIYAGVGEGCLSVNREVEGIIPRYARVSVEAFDENGNAVKHRVREELAIAFQHEIDHLNGILFVDKIDKKNPFKNMEQMREI